MAQSQEKKQDGDTDSHSERRLYRQGSHGSSLHIGDGGIVVLGSVNGSVGAIPTSGSKTNISIRSRTPSGKSIRSRTATRAEYHEDLKKELKQGFTPHLLLLSFIIMIGNSFIFGYNIGVLNQPVALIRQFYNTTYTNRQSSPEVANGNEADAALNLSLPFYTEVKPGIDEYTITFLWSLTTTLFVIGGMIGAYVAGYLADRVGRKRACLINCIPCFVGAIVSTVSVSANSPELLMLGRFITGLNCGVATQLAPMYLLEIAPYNLKGAFGTANQLFITIGIFVSSIWGLREILGTESSWPYLLLLNCVPSLVCLFVLPFLPDSPRYLMLSRKDRDGAEKALKFIRQQSDVTADMEEMETELSDNSGGQKKSEDADESYTMMRLLKTKDLRMPLFVAIFLQVIQQLSGINAIFFYSTGIYKNAGVPEFAIQYAVIVTNAINVIMTIVAVPIMDKAGRRPLLLYPMIVMVFILALITVALSLQAKLAWMSYISIACVIGYVICFAIGLGPIPMMITAELFRQGPRPRAMSLAGLANWFFTAVVAISFEMIQALTKEYTFIIFLVLMIGFTAFVFFKVPETKNKTFEEIASVFQPGGEIEVEEVVEFPIYTGADQMDEETDFSVGANARLMADYDQPNGNLASAGKAVDDVSVKVVDEEKQALKSSTENV